MVPNETRFGPDRAAKLDDVSGAASSTMVVFAVEVPGRVATLSAFCTGGATPGASATKVVAEVIGIAAAVCGPA
jgi:hypothetical protein